VTYTLWECCSVYVRIQYICMKLMMLFQEISGHGISWYIIRFYFVRKRSTSWFLLEKDDLIVNSVWIYCMRTLTGGEVSWIFLRLNDPIMCALTGRHVPEVSRPDIFWKKNDLIELSVWMYSMRALIGRHSPEVSCPDFFGLVDSQVRHICQKETCIYGKRPATESYTCD